MCRDTSRLGRVAFKAKLFSEPNNRRMVSKFREVKDWHVS